MFCHLATFVAFSNSLYSTIMYIAFGCYSVLNKYFHVQQEFFTDKGTDLTAFTLTLK